VRGAMIKGSSRMVVGHLIGYSLRTVSRGPIGGVVGTKGGSNDLVLSNIFVKMTSTREGIDIAHEASGAMNNGEVVAHELLRPTSKLVDGAVAFENFLDGAAITDPIKMGTPQVLTELGNGVAAGINFAGERVIMTFALGAEARPKSNGLKTTAGHEQIECAISRSK